ncbi:MAG: ComEC/Rec2 family competence protein [Rikenellaceae bacterium]
MKGSRNHPLLWVMIPLFLGAYSASVVCVHYLWVSVAVLILGIVLLLSYSRGLLYIISFCCGYLLSTLSSAPHIAVPELDNTVMAITINRSGKGEILAYQDNNGQWCECSNKVIINGIDSIEYCNVQLRGTLKLLRPEANEYHRIMQNSGFEGIVNTSQLLSASEPAPPFPNRINQRAYENLLRLPLRKEAFASAAAMALDRPQLLDKEITQAYAQSGAAHILALSGLHLGIVLLIVAGSTQLWSLAYGGHIAATIFSLCAVWLFALMTGMSDSVMRAVWMFTIFQLTTSVSRYYSSLNSLVLTAVIMFAIDPAVIYAPSFQLSFVAVFAIIFVGGALVRLTRRHKFWHDYLVGSVIIATVATIATAPLIAYYFGYISLLSPIITIFIIPLLIVIILASIVWVLLPLPFLSAICGTLIEVATTLQNGIVRWFASLNWGYIDCHLSGLGVAICYLLMLFLMVLGVKKIDAQLRKDYNLEPWPRS